MFVNFLIIISTILKWFFKRRARGPVNGLFLWYLIVMQLYIWTSR